MLTIIFHISNVSHSNEASVLYGVKPKVQINESSEQRTMFLCYNIHSCHVIVVICKANDKARGGM